jgi:hypothetical protein
MVWTTETAGFTSLGHTAASCGTKAGTTRWTQSIKHKPGPNGAENNHDICYAYSDDLGATWKTGGGATVADLSKGESVNPSAEGVVAFSIPKNTGLTNQESQSVDHNGGVHVSNRDNMGGHLQWKHYYRSPAVKGLEPVDERLIMSNL